jgi:hypothetical protein
VDDLLLYTAFWRGGVTYSFNQSVNILSSLSGASVSAGNTFDAPGEFNDVYNGVLPFSGTVPSERAGVGKGSRPCRMLDRGQVQQPDGDRQGCGRGENVFEGPQIEALVWDAIMRRQQEFAAHQTDGCGTLLPCDPGGVRRADAHPECDGRSISLEPLSPEPSPK